MAWQATATLCAFLLGALLGAVLGAAGIVWALARADEPERSVVLRGSWPRVDLRSPASYALTDRGSVRESRRSAPTGIPRDGGEGFPSPLGPFPASRSNGSAPASSDHPSAPGSVFSTRAGEPASVEVRR